MTIITTELRVALREFKESINSLNFVINYVEPPHPIGSIESYQAQLKLANEYLEKYPSLNSEEFNTVGMPLFVKNTVSRYIERDQLLQDSEKHISSNELLWEAYMVLDHGNHDERLVMLDKLEKHFNKFGKPISKQT